MSSETEAIQISGLRFRLAKLIGEQKPFEWAKAIGIPSSTFDRVWNHEATPRPEHLLKISRRCGVSIDWLLTGQTSTSSNSSNKDILSIPFLKSSENDEALVDKEQPDLSLSRALLSAKFESKNVVDLYAFRMRGDAMEPTVSDGDVLVLERSNKHTADGISALIWNGEIHIRRVASYPSGISIISDNSSRYPSMEITKDRTNQLNFIGKVIWVGKRF